MRRRWRSVLPASALAALVLAAGEEAAPIDWHNWNRTAYRYPGIPMTNDTCECLNWKQLYMGARIWCGEGLEFYSHANSTSGFQKEELMPLITAPNASGYQHYEHTCTLYKRLDTNRCMNLGAFAWDPEDWVSTEQWCYVPFSCKSLNGGGRLKGRPVSWKICERGKDSLFRDLSPEEVFEYVGTLKTKGIIGSMFRYVYPILRPQIWFDVKKKWRRKEYSRLPEMMLSAMRHNMPLVVETMPSTQSTFANKKVIYNGTLWAIVCMDAANPACLQREEDFGHIEL